MVGTAPQPQLRKNRRGARGRRPMLEDGEFVMVRAGIFTSESPVHPIRVRTAAAGTN